jgi:outer membrane lipoprotein-sorting protein
MRRLPSLGAVLAAVISASCGASLQKLPTGPGLPATDAVEAFQQATAACRRVSSLSAELAVSGSAGQQRLRGRVLAGLAAPDSVYLDAAAPFGASLFMYAAREGRATLLLPRDRRVLIGGDPAAVLEAVTGVPLDAADLRWALTGCAPAADPASGAAFGERWRSVTLGSAVTYLHRESSSAAWRLVSVVTDPGGQQGWRADYADFADGLPRTVRLISGDGGRRFNLRLALSQVETNPALEASIFVLRVPDDAVAVTLDEIRRAGPLGEPRER